MEEPCHEVHLPLVPSSKKQPPNKDQFLRSHQESAYLLAQLLNFYSNKLRVSEASLFHCISAAMHSRYRNIALFLLVVFVNHYRTCFIPYVQCSNIYSFFDLYLAFCCISYNVTSYELLNESVLLSLVPILVFIFLLYVVCKAVIKGKVTNTFKHSFLAKGNMQKFFAPGVASVVSRVRWKYACKSQTQD